MRNITITAIALLITGNATAAVRYEYTGMPVGSNTISIISSTDKVQSFIVLSSSPSTGNYGFPDFLDFGARIGSLMLNKSDGADIGAHLEIGQDGQITSWSLVIGKYSSPMNHCGYIPRRLRRS